MGTIKNDFIHLVLFWLKEPQNSDHREHFKKALKKLSIDSKYAKEVQLGTPSPSERDVVDDSYTFSLLVTFPSKDEHDQYQTEPAHIAFIDSCKPLWERVQVFDSEAIN